MNRLPNSPHCLKTKVAVSHAVDPRLCTEASCDGMLPLQGL